MKRLLSAILLFGLLTGCSTPASPASRGRTDKAQGPAHEAEWNGLTERGIAVYWENRPGDTDETVRANAVRLFDYAKSLNANAISLSFPFYTDGPTSTTLRGGPKTPSPQQLQVVLAEAATRQLRATVRPILNEDNLLTEAGAWRGTIKPTSRNQWFASYTQFLTPYAQAAEAGQAKTFTVSTELNSLDGDPRWANLVTDLKKHFTGASAIDLNWDNYLRNDFTLPVDSVGLDAYPPLQLGDGATVDQLVAAWNTWLDRKTKGPLTGVVLSEVGIAAQNGVYPAPFTWGSETVPLNLTVQANWFAAVCQVAKSRKTTGIYWWNANFHDDPAALGPDQPNRMSFVGRPTEQTIRNCFANGGR